MNCIPEAEWLKYAAGTLPAVEAERIRMHLEACPECGLLQAELAMWETELTKQGVLIRTATALPDEKVDEMLQGALSDIRIQFRPVPAARDKWTISEGVLLLRYLMEPICGRGMAKAVIGLALRRSIASPEDALTDVNWPVFVSNLSDAVGSICGVSVGRLVSRAGVCLTVEGA